VNSFSNKFFKYRTDNLKKRKNASKTEIQETIT